MKKISLLIATAIVSYAQAQTFQLDTTFAVKGKMVCQNVSDLGQIIKKSDGKILAVGRKTSGPYRFAVEQYLPNGTLDTTFGTNGVSYIGFNGGEDRGKAIGIQSNGKIIVGGNCQKSSSNNSLDYAITRLNADGSIDSTFGTNGRFTYDNNNNNFDQVNHLIVQPDDKIIFAGGAGPTNLIARLTVNGTFDNTFGTNGIYSGGGLVSKMVLTPDGKLYTVTTGGLSANVRKITSAGIDDPSFLNGNNYSESVVMAPQSASIALLSSGKVLLYAYNNIMGSIFTLLNSDGTVDSASFGKVTPANIGYDAKVNISNLFETSGGKIIAPGFYDASSINKIFCVSRFGLTNKRIDSTFADSGYFHTFSHQPTITSKNEYLNLVIAHQDGNLLFGGSSCSGACAGVIYKFLSGAPATGLDNPQSVSIQPLIYPNPAHHEVSIQNVPLKSKLLITDITGKKLHEEEVSKEITTIPTAGLNKGMYIIQINHNGTVSSQKLFINN